MFLIISAATLPAGGQLGPKQAAYLALVVVVRRGAGGLPGRTH